MAGIVLLPANLPGLPHSKQPRTKEKHNNHRSTNPRTVCTYPIPLVPFVVETCAPCSGPGWRDEQGLRMNAGGLFDPLSPASSPLAPPAALTDWAKITGKEYLQDKLKVGRVSHKFWIDRCTLFHWKQKMGDRNASKI